MPSYVAAAKIERALTDVLVVHCSDYRIQAGLNEFLNKGLNLRSNYDLLTIPGGPQCLTLIEYLPKFSWAGWKWLRFLVEVHSLKRLILIAHQDCAWYKDLPLHLHTVSEPRERQEEDLHRARTALTKEFPDLRVELYYAGWDDSNQLTIDSIPG